MRFFASPLDLLAAVGTDLGTTDWLTVDQARIDAFATATGDEQWIHVDPLRAATGPVGGTIAHGYLTLSLLAAFMTDLIEVGETAMAINYGLDRVRFIQPVRSGSRVRASGSITSAESASLGVRLGARMTVEIEGEEKPALVADAITLWIGAR
jgi:acyl dehydratase